MQTFGVSEQAVGERVQIIGDKVCRLLVIECNLVTWVKVFRINPKFRILRLTFHRKSASKC